MAAAPSGVQTGVAPPLGGPSDRRTGPGLAHEGPGERCGPVVDACDDRSEVAPPLGGPSDRRTGPGPAHEGPGERCGPVVDACDDRSEPAAGHDGLDAPRWAELAAAVLRDEGVGRGELGLRFVDPAAMAALNARHMGSVGPTDVLAFPIDGAGTDGAGIDGAGIDGAGIDGAGIDGAGGVQIPEQVPLLGDVVVCPAYAAEQATDHAGGTHDGSLGDELALLVVHGVLHVLGYDHQSDADAAAMQAREQQLLAAHYRRQ